MLTQEKIRLFSVKRDASGVCLLKSTIHQRDQLPNYIAISYNWDDLKVKKRRIRLEEESENGDHRLKSDFSLQPNISACLRRLADSFQEGTNFWVDAVCINQDESSEKETQIKEMGRTFERAEQVIVWLGQTNSDRSNNDRSKKKDVEALFHELKRKQTDLSSAATNGLAYLCHRKYWTRGWIVQEILVASKLEIWFDCFKFVWDDIASRDRPKIQPAYKLFTTRERLDEIDGHPRDPKPFDFDSPISYNMWEDDKETYVPDPIRDHIWGHALYIFHLRDQHGSEAPSDKKTLPIYHALYMCREQKFYQCNDRYYGIFHLLPKEDQLERKVSTKMIDLFTDLLFHGAGRLVDDAGWQDPVRCSYEEDRKILQLRDTFRKLLLDIFTGNGQEDEPTEEELELLETRWAESQNKYCESGPMNVHGLWKTEFPFQRESREQRKQREQREQRKLQGKREQRKQQKQREQLMLRDPIRGLQEQQEQQEQQERREQQKRQEQREQREQREQQEQQEQRDLSSIIDRLLEVRGSRPGKQVQLLESEISFLCTKAREIFMWQPMLLELEAPIKICGDVHGQYYDLLRWFEYTGFPPKANYLFLGNYVDYGKQSLETICLLLAYKIKYPENFFLLRGNHETASMNRMHGFYDECKQRYNIKLWKTLIDIFNCLPIAAIINDSIFATHGGLSPDLNSMEQIRRLMRPTDLPDCGILCDLIWSAPDKDITGWSENLDRGVGFTFGPDVVSRFLKRHNLGLICRAHQVVEDGYEFFSNRQLVTLFSAPDYRGEFNNAGAMMSVDENRMCSFQILKPVDRVAAIPQHREGALSRLMGAVYGMGKTIVGQ
ncbi:MAG: hypothetical protein Q9198_003950 [Flavoplaca austrocitrina]